MPIPELQKVREKYPQYNDMDDLTLATKLSQKYPQYSDLLDKAKEAQPKESLGRSLYRELVSPIVAGSSTLALGIPRATAKKTGTEELIYPEQKTFPGKALRFGSEAVGLLGGGALKAGEKVAGSAGMALSKLMPRLAEKGLTRKVIGGAITGGVAGALQTPEEGKGIVKPLERGKQALTWGGLGGAFPIAGATLGKTGEVVTKTGRWVAKNVGGITDATVSTIKRLGANRVFDPLKAKADYISQDLAPKVYNKMISFSTEANNAYRRALDSAPVGKKINIRPAIEEAGSRLKTLGLITEKGNLTELGQSEIARDSTYGKLLDFYKSSNAISGVEKLQGKGLTTGQMIKAQRAMRETLVNKDQYTFLRDKLNSLYKNKPSDIDVNKVVNEFYQSGENSGIKGLQKARELTRKVFEIEDKIDLNKISRDLIKAKNPQWTKVVQADYEDLVKKGILSKEEYKTIFDDLMAHFANIDFNLISETPGAGGGMYPSRSGLIRSGIGKAAKTYYKDIQPKTQGISETIKRLLKK